MNFSVSFPLSPESYTPNTQVCVYAPTGGWADFSTGWLSDEGLDSGQAYTSGETGGLCTSLAPTNYEWITGAYTTLTTGYTNDSLEFALNIGSSATVSGDIRVLVFETDGSGNWVETSDFTSASVSVASHASTVYVANSAADCGSNSPCFVNSSDNLDGGLGTGLRDAVNAASAGDTLQILGEYKVKSEAVLIDKAVTVTGVDDAAISSESTSCTESLLSITAGAAVENLTLDGTCSSSHRTLIEINSSSECCHPA